jgi:hypothetical protein
VLLQSQTPQNKKVGEKKRKDSKTKKNGHLYDLN